MTEAQLARMFWVCLVALPAAAAVAGALLAWRRRRSERAEQQ
jgi:MYXO-CTERM domain-containing protein